MVVLWQRHANSGNFHGCSLATPCKFWKLLGQDSDHTGAINNHFWAIRLEQYSGNTGPIHFHFRPIHFDSRAILLVQYSVNTGPILDQYTSFFDQYRFWPSEKRFIFHSLSAPAVCPSCIFILFKGIIRMRA